MGVVSYSPSAEASRIVQARLPICAVIVTQFVTHLARSRHPSESRWQSLDPTPAPGADAQSGSVRRTWRESPAHARSVSDAAGLVIRHLADLLHLCRRLDAHTRP